MNTWKAALSKRSRAKIIQFSVIWTSGINTESAGVLILQKKAIEEAVPVFVHNNTKSDNDNQRHHLPLYQVQVNSALPRSSIQVVWEVAVRGAVLQVTKSPPSPLIHYAQARANLANTKLSKLLRTVACCLKHHTWKRRLSQSAN